ncbi:MAG: SGNH hydrolase domain-containing protein [Verrucomicrobiaceae bacterium]
MTVTVAIGLIGALLWSTNGLPNRPGLDGGETAQFAAWPYMQNQTCLDRYPNEKAASYEWWFCETNKDQDPTLILLGNSYANQLYPGLVKRHEFAVETILSIGDCAVQRQLDLAPPNPCAGSSWDDQTKFVRTIIARNPSITRVIIAGLQWDASDNQLNDLREELHFLEQENRTTIVFYPHVEPPFHIHECLARPIIPARSNCHVSAEFRSQLYRKFQPTIDLVNREFPNVKLFDINQAYCDTLGCDFLSDGIPILRDEASHLSLHASDLVAQKFVQWVNTNYPTRAGITTSRR